MTFELWLGETHRPLDAHTPEQAVTRGTQFARRYKMLNLHRVQIVQVEKGEPPRILAVIHPWEEPNADETFLVPLPL